MSDKCMDGLSNTRPQITSEGDVRVLIDWLSITFDLQTDFQGVKEFLQLDHLTFENFDWGMSTFQEHIRSGNIVIQKKGDTRYQLFLTGQGCREYEQVGKLNWVELLALLKDLCNGRATRIDLAIDDFKGYYSTSLVRRTFLDGRCVTRFREASVSQSYGTGSVNKTMDSFYLGSQKSRLSVNFYDKKLEREGKGLQVTTDKWTRTELRCKREYADQVCDMILLYGGDVGSIALGILKKHIRFVSGKESNVSRRKTIKWWSDFLNRVEGITFSLVAPDKTIETTKRWLTKSVAPSLAMLREADPYHFDQFILEMLEGGYQRLSSRHTAMIQQYHNATPEFIDEIHRKREERINMHIGNQMDKISDILQKG